MSEIKSYKGLLAKLSKLEADVQGYLHSLDWLLSEANYQITLAYLFMKIEEGHHRLLKGILIKRHSCAHAKVEKALADEHFTRPHFLSLLQTCGAQMPADLRSRHSNAAKVRDKVIHGKRVGEAELRQSISDCIDYIGGVDSWSRKEFGFPCCGNMQGYLKSTKSLSPEITNWVLRGMGFKGVKVVSAD